MRKFYSMLAVMIVMMMASCTTTTVITKEQFNDIDIGMTFDEVKQLVGEPYDIKRVEPSLVEYLYIERVERGTNGRAEQRHYIFDVRDGKVESKRYKEMLTPFDVYAH